MYSKLKFSSHALMAAYKKVQELFQKEELQACFLSRPGCSCSNWISLWQPPSVHWLAPSGSLWLLSLQVFTYGSWQQATLSYYNKKKYKLSFSKCNWPNTSNIV